MKDYDATVEVKVRITAANETEAQERADMIEVALGKGLDALAKKPWLGDSEFEAKVEEQES